MAVTLNQLRDAIGAQYLANRPSFKRVEARAQRKGLEVTREQYDSLMRDMRTAGELSGEHKVDTSKFEVKKIVAGTWGKEGSSSQFKVEWHRRKDAGDELPIKDAPKPNFKETTRVLGRSSLTTLILPDMHFGFRLKGSWSARQVELEALHSHECVTLYQMVAREFQPKTIVILGDLLDLPSLGKYLTASDLRNLVQPAIDEAGLWLQGLREACPKARIVWIKGNHEERMDNYLKSLAPEFYGLSRAGCVEPVHGLRHLMHLEELKIELVEPYGEGIYIDGVWYTHGSVVGARAGDTVSKLLARHDHSVVCGHVHRLEVGYETRWGPNGPVEIFALSAGTGARIDGVVPGSSRSNWQNGFAAVWEGHVPHLHPIRQGACWIGGRVLSVEDLGETT